MCSNNRITDFFPGTKTCSRQSQVVDGVLLGAGKKYGRTKAIIILTGEDENGHSVEGKFLIYLTLSATSKAQFTKGSLLYIVQSEAVQRL